MPWYLVYWISLVFVTNTFALKEIQFTASRLPSGCKCLYNCRAVDCSSSGLTSMPVFNNNATKGITSMFLKNNSIKHLDLEDATAVSLRPLLEYVNQYFLEVVLLDMSSSKVETVSAYIGDFFKELRTLRLEDNRISTIGWISGLKTLRSLDLRRNSIESLSTDKRFLTLSKLQDVDLSSNSIVNVNMVSKWQMNALEKLNLSKNAISDLRDAYFPKNLLKLDVSHNRITALYPEFMLSIARVQWFSLSHNEIDSMSFLLKNRSRALWKVDLAGNKLQCTCGLYLEKVKVGRDGIVFGDEPFCSTGKKTRSSIFAFGIASCPQMVSDVCQDKEAFRFAVQGEKLTWERSVPLENANVSWKMIDESGVYTTSGSASIETGFGLLGNSVRPKTSQLCVHLSRGSLSCLHSCRLLPSTMFLSSTNQILVIVIAITGACVLLLLICFFVRERERWCGAPKPPQMQYAASMHSMAPSMRGSRTDMLMETNLDNCSGVSAIRPVSAIVTNGNQTVPVRHFVRKQPLAGGHISMHAKRASLFQSERYLASASMQSLPNFQSMGRLNSSRQSLASRALPELPGNYCEMANVPVGQTAYEFMEDSTRPEEAGIDAYQELGYQ